jgi:hypothetical protein
MGGTLRQSLNLVSDVFGSTIMLRLLLVLGPRDLTTQGRHKRRQYAHAQDESRSSSQGRQCALEVDQGEVLNTIAPRQSLRSALHHCHARDDSRARPARRGDLVSHRRTHYNLLIKGEARDTEMKKRRRT